MDRIEIDWNAVAIAAVIIGLTLATVVAGTLTYTLCAWLVRVLT